MSPMISVPKGPLWFKLLLFVVLVFLIYSNTLKVPFLLDDSRNIVQNPHIRLINLTWGAIIEAGFESPCSDRPVANVSFALNYYSGQYNVLGYHLINMLIHATTGILLYLLVTTTLSLPSLSYTYEPHGWIPFFTALIWLVHPIQTQSVTYIVQRMNSMAAMFYVLSLFLYAKGRLAEPKRNRWALFAFCIASGMLSLGCKQTAVTLPLFIFLYEWYFFQDVGWTWLKRRFFPVAGILILFAILALTYLGAHPLEDISRAYGARDFTLTQRVLTELRVVISYISLLIFPHPLRLNLDHDFPLSNSLVDPTTTLLSLGVIAGLIGLSIHMAKKERLLSFCILWFLGNLVIESSVIGLEIIFEHRTYLPSILVSLMAVTLAHRYIRPKWLGFGVLCSVVMVFSVWTYQRNSVWSDRITLWRDCVEKSPKKARPHYNLGNALAQRGRLDEAIAHYSKALQIKPNYSKAHNNLGNALADQGRLKEAIAHYSTALRIRPHYAEAHYNLGLALADQGRLEEAIRHYTRALQIKPDFADVYYNLGNALARQGRPEEAIRHYRKALQIKPDFAELHCNLGNALAEQGRLEEAIRHYTRALQIRPGFAEVRTNLRRAMRQAGKSDRVPSTSGDR